MLFTIKGQGVRIVGDHMDHFTDSDLVMMGAGVPHLFKNDEKEINSSADFIIVKFKSLLKEASFFSLPELSSISSFIENTKRGILFSKSTIAKIRKPLIDLVESKGSNRIVKFIEVLDILSKETDYKYMASEGEDRIQKVINYIGDNYVKDISLDDLADVAYMTTNSFCRYFKSRAGKTAFQFIREYRVNKACQMLINGKKSIADICYDTGFNSFSSFNRIFKNLKDISASEYKNKYVNLNS